ncbi:MAG: DUF992 domain-containing protein [Candidatus Binataceae bacterium]
MRISRSAIMIAGLIVALAMLVPCANNAGAQAAPEAQATPGTGAGVKIGYLTCHVSSGWGYIIGSSNKLRCVFSSTNGYSEDYTGNVHKWGVDIGYLKSAVLLWGVVSPTTNLGKGALAGNYGGVTASVALGLGAGVNVLVGGFKHSITLEPLSIEGQKGLNVAAGIKTISLKFERREAKSKS